MKTTIIIILTIVLGNILVAGEKNLVGIPAYRKEFLVKLGIPLTLLGNTGSWQLDAEAAATKTGLSKIYESAINATEECSAAKYFRIRKKEDYIVIDRYYPQEAEAHELSLYLFFDNKGAFKKVGCTESIIILKAK